VWDFLYDPEERSVVVFFQKFLFVVVVVVVTCRVIRECMLSFSTFWNSLWPKTFLFFINNQWVFESRLCSVLFFKIQSLVMLFRFYLFFPFDFHGWRDKINAFVFFFLIRSLQFALCLLILWYYWHRCAS